MSVRDGYLGTSIKGSSIIARIEYIRDKLGAEKIKEILSRLPANEQALLDRTILPSNRYPMELNAHLDQAIAQVLNPRNPVAVYRDLGRASAQRNLKAFHKTFLQGEGPHSVLSRFPAVRRTYYSDGLATYEKLSEKSGRLRIEGAKSHAYADCESTAGYFERAIELVGASSARVELTRCRERDDPHCELGCTWQ